MSNSWLQHPTTSNLLKKSYVKSFVDVSGDVYVRNANVEGFNADISMNGTIACNSLTLTEGTGAGVNSDIITAVGLKQDTIVAGSGISVIGDTISASAGGADNIAESSSTALGNNWNQVGAVLNVFTATTDSTSVPNTSVRDVANSTMSGDGTTIFQDSRGLFTYNGTSWVNKGNTSSLMAAIPGARSWGGNGHGRNQFHLDYDGTTLIIGSHRAYNGGFQVGSLNVWKYNGSLWQKMGQTLYGNNSGDTNEHRYLGESVRITSNGLRIIASAPFYWPWPGPATNKPKLRIYDWNSGTNLWDLQAQIAVEADKPDITAIDINHDGTVIAVGMPVYGSNPNYTGAGRVYEYDGSSWVQKGSDILGPGANARLGYGAGSNSDGTIVAFSGMGGGYGVAKILQWDGSDWAQMGSDIIGPASSFQGISCSLNDDGTIINLLTNQFNPTYIRSYKWNGSTWSLIGGDVISGPYSIAADNSGYRIITSTQVLEISTVTITDTVVSENLDISGNLNVIGDISVSGTTVHSSDIRAKTNLQTLTNCLDAIMKLSPEIYDKKSKIGNDYRTLTRESGFIAQEIWYNIPELRHLVILPDDIDPSYIQDISFNRVKPVYKDIYDISTNGFINPLTDQIEFHQDDGSITYEDIIDTNDYTDTSPDYARIGWGLKPASINYNGLIAYLIKGIQELKGNIELQTEEIESLNV